MGLPKVGQFVPPGQDYAGIVRVVPIGIPEDILSEREPGEAELLEERQIAEWLPEYARSDQKGRRGHLLIVTGSPGMTGAGCLAAEAALVSGVGLVTVAVPASLNSIYEIKLTESMSLPVPDGGTGRLGPEGWETIRSFLPKVDAVVFGPGVGKDPRTAMVLESLIRETQSPILIDADGLNLLAGRLDLLRERPGSTVLTPHPGEMGRLLGMSAKEVQADRWDSARRLAERTKAVVVLKGAGTVITDGESLFVNPTGNPAMSQGGMGDVLSGAIGARLAGKMEPIRAAAVGVYLHGLAADEIVQDTGWTVVRAGEVVEALRDAEERVRLTLRQDPGI
jgi:NAD(P)H-hydrate epimerase